jgi:hypothetical protein
MAKLGKLTKSEEFSVWSSLVQVYRKILRSSCREKVEAGNSFIRLSVELVKNNRRKFPN